MNYLLAPFNEVHDAAPFDKINLSDFKPAFDKAIADALSEIQAICENKEAPSFENTIERLEFSGMLLDRISAIFFNLNAAETSEKMQQLAQELSPLLSNFTNDIYLNEELFSRVSEVYNEVIPSGKKVSKDANHGNNNQTYTEEQIQLLHKKYHTFIRNGAKLNQAQKEELRKIDEELSKSSLTFNQNLLKETQSFLLHITAEEDLKGLPSFVIESAKEEANQRELDGWVFTLDYASYVPFITYAENRSLRKKMTIAFGSKGFQQNENDNQEIVKKIVQLRAKRAQILGFAHHSEYVLKERMAESSENVIDFLNDLLEKALPAAEKELETLNSYAYRLDGIAQIEKWDSAYYIEKLKKEHFQLNDEMLKPYFELKSVLNGAFEVANRLFGIQFHPTNAISVYHPDVLTYEVYDENGQFLSLFYADFHPRKGKRAGAWMTSFKNQYIINGVNNRPHVAIVCNFTKPTANTPALLTFNEVTTLFHEFGHALHGIFANTTYPSLSGTNVFWDFVELPSQIFENWCYQEEALNIFAKHYQTNEPIPTSYIKKIKESANFMEGLATVRQLSFGLLDMAYHSSAGVPIEDIKAFELQAMGLTTVFPDISENCMSTQFAHIFAGGYAAGYYSYKWAEVLDADAFEYFLENGIFSRDIANKFREFILSQGGTVHPMQLYKMFRGKAPRSEALLKRSGLLKISES